MLFAPPAGLMVPEQPEPIDGRKEPGRTGDDAAFLERLGREVRWARGRRGLSRKLLARYSGVSERYLAQLETGQGNISILLLRQVAAALDMPVETLIAGDGEGASGIASLLPQLRRATPEQRRRVREVLAAQDGPAARGRRVALIGLRGAGKSTLGRLVAGDLGLPFVELNDEITALAGLGVQEIFNLYGPEGYRRIERRALGRVVDRHDAVVLASGGGIVADATTFDMLLGSFFTVWLRAAPEDHMNRVRAQGDLRPMAGNDEAMDDLKLILESREVLYGRADRRLDTSAQDLEGCREALAGLLQSEDLAGAASS